MHDMRDAVHDDFERNRDLLFDLFCRNPWPLRDDLDVVIGHVGIRLNGQSLERNNPPSKKDQCQSQDKKAVAESEINDSANHFIAPQCFAVAKRLRPLDLRA